LIAAKRGDVKRISEKYDIVYSSLVNYRLKLGCDMLLGTNMEGNSNPNHILEETDIPVIRECYSRGVSKKELGERYGVHPSTIYLAVARKTWKHVE